MSEYDSNEFISVREVAKLCGRNTETVRRWIWSGKLPAEKLGNQLFIRRSDLANFHPSVQSYSAKIRETAIRYRAEPKEDFPERAGTISEKMSARTDRRRVEEQYEERMEQNKQKMRDSATIEMDRDAKLNFLREATVLRNQIHARTGNVFSAEEMIRELREERGRELE